MQMYKHTDMINNAIDSYYPEYTTNTLSFARYLFKPSRALPRSNLIVHTCAHINFRLLLCNKLTFKLG